MIWFLAVLAFLLGMLLFILICPFYFTLNTKAGIFEVKAFTIIKAKILFPEKDLFLIRITTPVKNFEINPVEKISEKKSKPKKKKAEKPKKKKKPFNVQFNNLKRAVKEIVRSFKVHYFKMNIDTGNYMINGVLIPVFVNISKNNLDLKVNFNSEFYLSAKIRNNLIRIIYPVTKFFIIHKFKGAAK